MAGRRRVGVRGMMKKREMMAARAEAGNDMAEVEIANVSQQLALFKDNLEAFATCTLQAVLVRLTRHRKHKKKINKDPVFRRDFQKMCQRIGVDPLASNKGFWSELLGVGDFYYELGVQIVEACLQARSRTGGLIDLQDLHAKVLERRGSKVALVTTDDLEGAIKKLKVLGSGFRVHTVGDRKIVQSVPTELNLDHSRILSEAAGTASITASELVASLEWQQQRAVEALNQMVKEGMCWVDDQGGTERRFWFAGLMAQA